jgi:hypothetical protein
MLNYQVFGLMKGKIFPNNEETQKIQNILFGDFTELHKLVYFFQTTNIYFEKQSAMITCFCELFRVFLTA